MSSESPRLTQLPEAMEVADVGPYLKSLREHYRLSANDVAHRLHIRPRYIESIEASDFDSMPSKVYARGYVASYAEFLGVDPLQVVEICFGAAPVKKDDFFIPKVAKKTLKKPPSVTKWLAVLGAVVAAWLLYDYSAQIVPRSDEVVAVAEPAQETPSDSNVAVSAVPDDMLAHTRQLLMPTAELYRCLVNKKTLACHRAWQQAPAPKRSLVDARFIDSVWVRG